MSSKDKLKKAKEKSRDRRLEKVEEFSDKLLEKLGDKVKCVAVYGSVPEARHTHESDIDTFIVLDDTKLEEDVPSEAKDKIRKKVTKLAKETDERITIQYFTFLTEFWDSIRKGEPLIVAVLRKGEPVYDVGIFMPAKRMLQRGKIISSQEAVEKRLKMAALGYKKAEQSFKQSIPHKLEQAVANAGQAPIMYIGKTPPNKEDVGKTLKKLFVENESLEEKYVEIADKVHDFNDKAEKHPEEITAEEVEKHLEMTDDFIRRMHKLVGQLGSSKKVQEIIEDYKTFLKANVAALKSQGIEPPEEKDDLPDMVIENVEVEKDHREFFDDWEDIMEKVKEKELEDIDEKKLYELKERTKKFASKIGEDIKKLQDEKDAKEMAPKLETDKIAEQAKQEETEKEDQ